MSELLDLSSYKTKLSELISHSSMDDCELPLDFKTKFKGFGDYRIERYNRYTTLISSRKSILTIPNQWIYIAACCCQYHLELIKYRNRLLELGITEDEFEACHPSKDNRSIPEGEKAPEVCKEKAEKFLAQYSGSDKAFLVNFLWNYNSWGGGKNIKRSNDFTVSPVLNIANTINASSSLIGDIAKGLANQLECLDLLLNSDNWSDFYVSHGTEVNDGWIKKAELDFPFQQIYYGAPGTGKSFEVKKITKSYSTIRTTFHPDSDYSTFVGAYKPTMEETPVYGAQGLEVAKEKRITYSYVKQAFLKAYLGAWQKYAMVGNVVEPQFLVIEEINRGNCAQIFGDLFQLLDRGEDGFSTYPIEADSDLQVEIEKAFGEDGEYALAKEFNVEGVVPNYTSNYEDSSLTDDIKYGRVLLLPNNLYIWATMNTSDQSLFPVDSAFKRRWDWRYVKISNAGKGWKIKCGEEYCDWWKFVEEINKRIAKETSSDDKKLGYFFCKPPKDSVVITEKMFVGKVLFYLWNDVFKDGDISLFNVNDDEKAEICFDAFYNDDNKVNVEAVRRFLVGVVGNLNAVSDEDASFNMTYDDNANSNDNTRYSFDGETRLSKAALGYNIVMKYIKEYPDKTFDELQSVLAFDNSVNPNSRFGGVLVPSDAISNSYNRYYKEELISSDGVKYKVLSGWNKYNIDFIIKFAKAQGWVVDKVTE